MNKENLINGNDLQGCKLIKTAKLYVENEKRTFFDVIGYFIDENIADNVKNAQSETENYNKSDFEITTVYLLMSDGKYFSLEDGIEEVELSDKKYSDQ